MEHQGQINFVLGAMSICSNKIDQLCSEVLENITFKQWFLLMMIQNMGEGPKSLQDVADFCGTTRQNTRRILSLLEKQGYVAMEPSRFDGRALEVKLTRKGNNQVEQGYNSIAQVIDPLFEQLGDRGLDALVTTLKDLLLALENTDRD